LATSASPTGAGPTTCTSIGDVNTSTGDVSAGFLGKTLKYQGDGKYELRAHVSIGDISLEGK
jgi:hypothetical protein